jgi:lysophospholipase L1-like esterase
MVGKARAVNAQVRAYAEADPQDNVEFVDVFTPMLGPDGEPRAELYRSDALHLNDAGYALWRTLLLPHLR